jgi:hypothetical protein
MVRRRFGGLDQAVELLEREPGLHQRAPGAVHALHPAFVKPGPALHEMRTKFVRPELEAVLETVLADGSTCLDHADGRLRRDGAPTHHAKGSL